MFGNGNKDKHDQIPPMPKMVRALPINRVEDIPPEAAKYAPKRVDDGLDADPNRSNAALHRPAASQSSR